MAKNPPANAGEMGSIPGLGRFHVLHLAAAKPCTTRTEPVLKSVGATTTEQCGGY